MGGDEGVTVNRPTGPTLDGGWDYQAQFKALKGSNPMDDLSFRENSVKDVTDRGRMEGAGRLQQALELALSERAQTPPKKKSQSTPTPTAADKELEAEVCLEVRKHRQTLQRLREDPPTADFNTFAMDVLKQLGAFQMSAVCLKSTKIAAELNQPFWRGGGVPEAVRLRAAALVRGWRVQFREQTGLTAQDAMTPAARSKKCRSLSMDLEEQIYSKHQKASMYTAIVDLLGRLVRVEVETAVALLAGTVQSADLVNRVVLQLKQLQKDKRKPLTAWQPR